MFRISSIIRHSNVPICAPGQNGPFPYLSFEFVTLSWKILSFIPPEWRFKYFTGVRRCKNLYRGFRMLERALRVSVMRFEGLAGRLERGRSGTDLVVVDSSVLDHDKWSH